MEVSCCRRFGGTSDVWEGTVLDVSEEHLMCGSELLSTVLRNMHYTLSGKKRVKRRKTVRLKRS